MLCKSSNPIGTFTYVLIYACNAKLYHLKLVGDCWNNFK